MTALLTGACSGAAQSGDPKMRRDERAIAELLDDIARAELSMSPETASRLNASNLAEGAPDQRGRLDDRSHAGFERRRLMRLETLRRLEAAPPPALGRKIRADFDIVRNAYDKAVAAAAFGFGRVSLSEVRPYAADQLNGAYTAVPDLLVNRTSFREPLDARRYLDRLAALAKAVDDERRRLVIDALAGVTPPDFVLERMFEKALALREGPASSHILFVSFNNLMIGVEDLSPEDRQRLSAEAEQVLDRDVLPAYSRFVDTLDALLEDAPAAPGVWVMPMGDAYYETVLAFHLGAETQPETLHAEGLADVAALSDALDAALVEIDLTEGTVGERLAALARTETVEQDVDTARIAALTIIDERINWMAARLDEIVERPPRTSLAAVRVPDFQQDTAPGAYYAPAPADGSAPGLFYINLRDPTEWPAFALPTLTFHEGAPGHHLESALAAEQGGLRTIRRLIWPTAYGEGWALYAEDLADELGAYENDPLGRIGYQQSLLFRAARLVADTGVHRMRWTRGEAVDYLVAVTGQPRSAMETEVERYAVWPGQAASYVVGRDRFRALRERAESVLGDRFNPAAFHREILIGGPRPLDFVERDIDAWIARELR